MQKSELSPIISHKESIGYRNAVKSLRRAAYTLWVPPKDDNLQTDVASLTKQDFLTLQPPIEMVLGSIYSDVSRLVSVDKSCVRKLKKPELLQISSVLIQFTDHVPESQTVIQTPYTHIKDLYDAFVSDPKADEGLAFDDQLKIALKQSDGNLPDALWRLFIASRHYARWLDGRSIANLPEMSRNEKKEAMINWQRSLKACKPSHQSGAQDASGDAYYTWTHAFSAYMLNVLPENSGIDTQVAAKLFRDGTKIMQKLVHRVTPQYVQSDHSIASSYGNAIGEACVNIWNFKKSRSNLKD